MNSSREIDSLKRNQNSTSLKTKVFSTFAWLFLWPLVLLIPSIGLLMALGRIRAEWMTGRAYIAIFVIILTILCLFFIRLQRKSESDFQNNSAPVLQAYMVCGILVGAFVVVALPDQPTSLANAGIDTASTNSVTVPTLEVDPSIQALLVAVGAQDTYNLEMKFVEGFDEPTHLGQYKAYLDPTGKWSYGVLEIKKGQDGSGLNRTVAHEYLHHIWYKVITNDTKQKLTSDLITVYGNDLGIKSRLTAYSEKQKLQPTELFSFYCTESSDGYLTEYILAECNKYIDRSSLAFAR